MVVEPIRMHKKINDTTVVFVDRKMLLSPLPSYVMGNFWCMFLRERTLVMASGWYHTSP